MAKTAFREWLGGQIEGQQISRRELARRLASRHPDGANGQTIETYRRALYKYLDPERPTLPSMQTRRAVAEALGVSPSELPADEEDEEEPDLELVLLELAQAQADLSRRTLVALRKVRV